MPPWPSGDPCSSSKFTLRFRFRAGRGVFAFAFAWPKPAPVLWPGWKCVARPCLWPAKVCALAESGKSGGSVGVGGGGGGEKDASPPVEFDRSCFCGGGIGGGGERGRFRAGGTPAFPEVGVGFDAPAGFGARPVPVPVPAAAAAAAVSAMLGARGRLGGGPRTPIPLGLCTRRAPAGSHALLVSLRGGVGMVATPLGLCTHAAQHSTRCMTMREERTRQPEPKRVSTPLPTPSMKIPERMKKNKRTAERAGRTEGGKVGGREDKVGIAVHARVTTDLHRDT